MINRIAGLVDPEHAPSLASVKEAWKSGANQTQKVLKQLEQTVINNPGASLAAAFAVGIAFAWWLKRR